ncbi:hypothetical protein [Pectinatus frisingensis]|uniref:hypothetical protein n=1 Tax=Pectinatus frisingensis TaxID=865 RepID=UPI001E3FD376|nr:hypothetical protein [Pectinatus frisingensis]
MAKQIKEIHKVEMTDGKWDIIQQLFREYSIEKSNNIQDVLKDLLGGHHQGDDGVRNGRILGLQQIITLQ